MTVPRAFSRRKGPTMQRLFVLVAMLVMALASTSATTAQEATPPAGEQDRPACAATLDSTPTADTDDDADTDLADWQTMTLTDARTGDEFAVADFVGCTVYVETMATWCSTCRAQLEHVATAAEELDPDRFVFIAISVETEISDEDLARYADDASFDWLFSVARPDALKEIVDEFGRESIVPPSTPHLIVNPDGSYGALRTGGTPPEEIVELMTDASGAAAES